MRKVACRALDYATLYMLHIMKQFDYKDSSKIDVKDIVLFKFIYSAQNSNDSQLFILVLIKNPSTLH